MAAPSTGNVDRNAGLDLLRAAAIVIVVGYHVIQMSPVPLPRLMRVAQAGQYGVDLFFVLSGWLIGGLYWRERAQFGNVELLRFWLRRWLRTIPPYLVALTFAWLAVRIARREAFDWGYLAFIQNYYARLPYFLVSWSLCIEEHFYIFLPLLFVVPIRREISFGMLFSVLLVVAPVSRWWLSLDGLDPDFGFEQTATHLRMEGLLLGFWLARVQISDPARWKQVTEFSPWVVFGAGLVLVAAQFAGGAWMYRIGLTVLAAGLAGLLVFMGGRPPGRMVASRWIKAIALSSYSVYLVHPLMIHAARKLIEKEPMLPWPVYFPLVLVLVASGGAVFYLAVERVAIVLRDRWVPRRTRTSSARRARKC